MNEFTMNSPFPFTSNNVFYVDVGDWFCDFSFLWDLSGTPLGSLFVTVRDSGGFLVNPWLQNASSEHPKNNPPPRLPPKSTPKSTFGLQAGPKMAQAPHKAQKNIENDYRNDPKATQRESLDKKHPDRRHRPQGLFNKLLKLKLYGNH